MKKIVVLLVLGLFISFSAFAQDPESEPGEVPAGEEARSSDWERTVPKAQIKLNWWTGHYKGRIRYEDVDAYGGTVRIVGEELDLEDELGLDNPQNIWEPEVVINFNDKHSLILSYFTVNYGGEERLDSTVEFGGFEFAVNTDLETIYRLDRFLAMYEYRPLVGDQGALGIRAGMEYWYWELGFEGTEIQSAIHVKESERMTLPIPMIGIAGYLYFPYGFGLYADFSGVGFAVGDYGASYTDLDAGLTFDYKYLHLGVGYRSLVTMVDLDDEDDEFRLKYNINHQGLVVSVGVNI